MSAAYSEIFSGRGHQNVSLFQASFLAKLTLRNVRNKNDFNMVRGMLPRKNFENLHNTVMAILELFEQFSGKVCLYFWPLILSDSPNMKDFVSTVSIMRAYGD